MKKLLVRFFPLLFLFFLIGIGGQSALAVNAPDSYSSDLSAEKTENHETAKSDADNQDFIIKHILSDVEQEDYEICAIDDSEREEERLFREDLEINGYFTSAFCTQASQYFSYYIKKRLSLHKQFFYFISSSRYITFRVFRL